MQGIFRTNNQIGGDTDCITKRLGIDWNNLWRISGSWESYNGWYCSMEKFLRPGKTERLASRILSDKQGLGRSAQPGLSPYMNCAEKEIIIPEAIYDGAHWDIRGDAPKQEKVFVVHLKKARETCQ